MYSYSNMKSNDSFNDILHIIVGAMFTMICFYVFGIEELYLLRESSTTMKSILAFIYAFMFGYVIKGINVNDSDNMQSYRNWLMTQCGGMLVIVFEMISNLS